MNICRQRYIVKRKSDNKILVGLARNKYWISEEEITDSTPIQTYVSAQKAISAASMSYTRIPSTEFVAEAVIESYKRHGCSFLVFTYVKVTTLRT